MQEACGPTRKYYLRRRWLFEKRKPPPGQTDRQALAPEITLTHLPKGKKGPLSESLSVREREKKLEGKKRTSYV